MFSHRATQRDRQSVSMNMTPLIDVVFLLIIFFLVSSHLARQETQLALNLPRAASGEDEASSRARRITLNLLSDGTLLLAGQPTSISELGDKLAFEAKKEEPLEIRLRADRAARYGQVEPVLVACAKSGVWDVRFAVREEDR